MRSEMHYFGDESIDDISDYLKSKGWSVGEIGVDNGWSVFAKKGKIRVQGDAKRRTEAWRDFIRKMVLAAKFSRN